MSGGDRVAWPPRYVAEKAFREVTDTALRYRRRDAGGLFAELLGLLKDCAPGPPGSGSAIGATFKQLALIGHLSNMDAQERRGWYEVAENIGLTQRHAGHIIARVQDGSLQRQRSAAEREEMGELIEVSFATGERSRR